MGGCLCMQEKYVLCRCARECVGVYYMVRVYRCRYWQWVLQSKHVYYEDVDKSFIRLPV